MPQRGAEHVARARVHQVPVVDPAAAQRGEVAGHRLVRLAARTHHQQQDAGQPYLVHPVVEQVLDLVEPQVAMPTHDGTHVRHPHAREHVALAVPAGADLEVPGGARGALRVGQREQLVAQRCRAHDPGCSTASGAGASASSAASASTASATGVSPDTTGSADQGNVIHRSVRRHT